MNHMALTCIMNDLLIRRAAVFAFLEIGYASYTSTFTITPIKEEN